MISAEEVKQIRIKKKMMENGELTFEEELEIRIKVAAYSEKRSLLIFKEYNKLLFKYVIEHKKEIEKKGFRVEISPGKPTIAIKWG